jgi:hypothetical protein
MGGFLGAVEGVVGDIAGGMSGGDFLGELMNVLDADIVQSSSSSDSGGTTSEMGQIAGDALKTVAAIF